MVLLFFIFTYLLGSIPFGLLFGKFLGKVDVRQHGSGNVGATNVLRTAGIVPAALVAVCDVGKGFLPVYLAQQMFQQPLSVALVGLLAVSGHTWSLFLGFKGGRGVATTFGVLAGLHLWPALVVIIIWFIFILLTRYVSLSSMIAVSCSPIVLNLFGLSRIYTVLGLVIALLIVFRHRSNIARLKTGAEPKIGGEKQKKQKFE